MRSTTACSIPDARCQSSGGFARARAAAISSAERTPVGRLDPGSVTIRWSVLRAVMSSAARRRDSSAAILAAGIAAEPAATWPSRARTLAAATMSRTETTPHVGSGRRSSKTTTESTWSSAIVAATCARGVVGGHVTMPSRIASATVIESSPSPGAQLGAGSRTRLMAAVSPRRRARASGSRRTGLRRTTQPAAARAPAVTAG